MASNAFNKNVKWNLEQVVVQARHAEIVNGRSRSGYYKAAVMISASVAEALAYKVLEKNSRLTMPFGEWECKKSHFLPSIYQVQGAGTSSRLSICERTRKKFLLDRYTDFKKVNEVCLTLNLFSKRLFNKIERVRILRNKIHIQGLSSIDRSYTKSELEFIASVINELLSKV